MMPALDSGLGRRRYFAAGASLFAVKLGLDHLLARAFDRPWSVLYYLNPSDAPLFHPEADPSYWLSMWAAALPFIAIGLLLTIRRLSDAGLSVWLALLFFAPFANVLFFAFCSLVPGQDAAAAPRDRGTGLAVRMPYGRAAAAAGSVGAVIGLTAFLAAVHLLGSYGAALFVGAPCIGGFVSGLLFARWHRPRFSGAILAALLSLPFAGVVVIASSLEGLICLAMAAPLVLAGSALGAAIGCLAQRRAPGGGVASAATALLMLPATLAAEALAPPPRALPAPVESSIIVNAPAQVVWRHVVAFPPLDPPREWIFRAGVAAPIGAVIEGEGVGAIRRCLFTTGSFIEPIEVWNPPKELRFAVVESPDPMREWTIREGARPPHLDGFLHPSRGQFLLAPLSGGRTRLIGRTWYTTNMAPEAYWRLWADPIIHTIHLRVLRHVAALSEAAVREEDSSPSAGRR